MSHRVATIALHTFKECVRERVLYTLVVFALLLIGAAILIGSVSIGIDKVLLVNLGLSAISVFGLLIAIFIGISLVSKEIERRTIYNLLSKPVARYEFILGKYLGLLLTLVVNTGVMTAGFYLTLFYQQRGLGSDDLAPLLSVYLIGLELALVVGVALLFSTLSSPVLSAMFTFCVFIVGNFLDDIQDFGRQVHDRVVGQLANLLYYLLPNFSTFNQITAASHGQRVPAYLVTSSSLYALLYVTILVGAAILIFEEREFR